MTADKKDKRKALISPVTEESDVSKRRVALILLTIRFQG